jgi:hypothetical protein
MFGGYSGLRAGSFVVGGLFKVPPLAWTAQFGSGFILCGLRGFFLPLKTGIVCLCEAVHEFGPTERRVWWWKVGMDITRFRVVNDHPDRL